MACTYTIKETGVVLSEKEFKQQLQNGLIDHAIVNNNVSIEGIKADKRLAKSYNLPQDEVAVEKNKKRSESLQNRAASLHQEFNQLSPSKKRSKQGSEIKQELMKVANEMGYTVTEATQTSDADKGKLELKNSQGKNVTKIAVKDVIADVSDEQVDVAKRAIDSGVLSFSGDPLDVRWDSDMSWADIRKGEKDLRAGNYKSTPAKRLILALNEQNDSGAYNFIQGSGGQIQRSSLPLDQALSENLPPKIDAETQKQIDDSEAQLVEEYDAWFESLDEESQLRILDEYEGRNSEETSENESEGESESNVLNEEKAVYEEIEEIILPPSGNIKRPRTMRKVDGEWELKVDGEWEPAPQLAKQAEAQLSADKTAEEWKGDRVEKRLAQKLSDALEGIKLGKDGNTVSVLIPPGIWNAAITAVQKSLLAGDSVAIAIEKAVKSVLKKAVKAEKITQDQSDNAVDYLKSVLEKNIESESLKPKARREAKMEIAELILDASGTLKRSGLTKGDTELARKLIYDYAVANLPRPILKTGEVTALLNTLTKDNVTDGDIQNSFDRIDKLVDKYAEKKRLDTISDIKAKLKKDALTIKKGKRRVGKISLEQQQNLSDYINSGVLEDLENKSQEQLDEINGVLDSIIGGGRAEQLIIDREKEMKSRRARAIYFESLAQANGKKPKVLSGKTEVLDWLSKPGGRVVIINGHLASSITTAEKIFNDNPWMDFSSVNGYTKSSTEVARENERNNRTIFRKKLPIKNLRILFDDLIKSTSKKFKDFVDEKIFAPIEKAKVLKNEEIRNKWNEVVDAKTEIFGSASKGDNRLNQVPTDRNYHGEQDHVSVGHIAAWWATMQQDTGNEQKGKSYKDRLENSNVDVDAVNDFMNDPANADVKAYAEFLLNDFLPSVAVEYQEVFMELLNKTFSDGVFFPTSADSQTKALIDVDNDSLFSNGGQGIIDATTSHLKERMDTSAALKTTKSIDEIMYDYISTMEHSKFYIPIAKNVNELFNNESRPELLKHLGSKNYKKMLQYLTQILTNESSFGMKNDTVKKTVGFLSTWTILTTLAFKPAQVVKQFVSTINLPGQGIKHGVYPTDIIAALVPKTKDERSLIVDVMKSDWAKQRYTGGGLDAETKRISERANKRTARKLARGINVGTDIAVKVGMAPITFGDWLSVFPINQGMITALYRKALKDGKSVAEAKEWAMVTFITEVENTMQSSRDDILTTQQQSDMGRLFFLYKSAQALSANKIIRSVKKLRSGVELTGDEKAQLVYDMVFFSVNNAAFTAVASKTAGLAIASLFGGHEFEDDDEKEKAWLDFIMDVQQSNIQGYGFIGTVMDWTLNKARGKSHFNSVPVIKMMTEELPSAVVSGVRLSTGSPWDDLSDGEKSKFRKTLGVKYINDGVEDWKEFSKGDQSFWDALMNYNDFTQSEHDYVHDAYEVMFGEGVPDVARGSRQVRSPRKVRTARKPRN
jgi:hypothetical protein